MTWLTLSAFVFDSEGVQLHYSAPIRSAIAPGTAAMNERLKSTSSLKACSGR